jgi:hypothetical protein
LGLISAHTTFRHTGEATYHGGQEYTHSAKSKTAHDTIVQHAEYKSSPRILKVWNHSPLRQYAESSLHEDKAVRGYVPNLIGEEESLKDPATTDTRIPAIFLDIRHDTLHREVKVHTGADSVRLMIPPETGATSKD